jgi:hypothetical protein
MIYNVRDRRGRFTKIRHSLRDNASGRFVPRTVKSARKYSLRDEATGRFRPAKKYNVRDERGRFAEENYRHNLRDETTGRFISARKDFDNIPWLTPDEEFEDWDYVDENDCDCAFCRGEENDFIWEFNDYDEPDVDDEFDWGVCTCCDDRVYDKDDDGTNFCATCLGDIPLGEPEAVEEDVVIVIVIG